MSAGWTTRVDTHSLARVRFIFPPANLKTCVSSRQPRRRAPSFRWDAANVVRCRSLPRAGCIRRLMYRHLRTSRIAPWWGHAGTLLEMTVRHHDRGSRALQPELRWRRDHGRRRRSPAALHAPCRAPQSLHDSESTRADLLGVHATGRRRHGRRTQNPASHEKRGECAAGEAVCTG